MDWGDLVQCTINEKKITGFVHYISHEDNYVEITKSTLFSEDYSVINDAWLGIYLEDAESGTTHDSLDVSDLKVIEVNDTRTFLSDREIEQDDIVIIVSHAESSLRGKRYLVEDINDSHVVLDDFDSEDGEEIRINLENGLKIFNSDIVDLYKESQEDGKEEDIEEELFEKTEETAIPLNERELTHEEKCQWIYEVISSKCPDVKISKERNTIIERFFQLLNDIDTYTDTPLAKWEKGIKNWEHFVPSISNKTVSCVSSEDLEDGEENMYLNNILKFYINEYESYLDNNGQYKTWAKNSVKYQGTYPGEDSIEYNILNNFDSFKAVLENGQHVKILNSFYLPEFFTNELGNIISNRSIKLLPGDKYSINSVNTPFGRKTTLDELIPDPKEFRKEYKNSNLNLSEFLSKYSTNLQDLPYEYYKQFNKYDISDKEKIIEPNTAIVPPFFLKSNKKNKDKTSDKTEINLNNDIKNQSNKIEKMYTNSSIINNGVWNIPELDLWQNTVWEKSHMMYVLKDKYKEHDSKVIIDDLYRNMIESVESDKKSNSRPPRLGEFKKINNKYNQYRLNKIGKATWIPTKFNENKTNNLLGFCDIENETAKLNLIKSYNVGKVNKIVFKKQPPKFKKRKIVNENEDKKKIYEMESVQIWDSFSKLDKKECARNRLNMLEAGTFLRLPRSLENELWYYDVKTDKESIPRHEYEKQLIILEAYKASIHLQTLLTRWGEPDGEGNWISKANGEILHVNDDQRAFGEGVNFNDIQNQDSEYKESIKIPFAYQELSEIFDEIIEITHVKSIDKGEIIKKCSKILEKSTEKEEVELITSWVNLIDSNPKTLLDNILPYVKIPDEKMKKYVKKWDDRVHRSSQYAYVLKNSKKKYIGFTAALVITSVFLESNYPVHIYGKSLFKQIIKSAKTPGLENVLKYAFKKKPDVDMFNDWIVETASKYWNANTYNTTQKNINTDYSYKWVGFRPNNTTKSSYNEIEKNKYNDGEYSITKKPKIAKEVLPPFIKHTNVRKIELVKDTKEKSEKDIKEWCKTLQRNLSAEWKEMKEADLTKPINDFEDWMFHSDMKKSVYILRKYVTKLYEVCRMAFNKTYLTSLDKIPSSWDILPGIEKKIRMWHKEDQTNILDMVNLWKLELEHMGIVDKNIQNKKLENFESVINNELGHIVKYLKDPLHLSGDEIVYVNIWLYTCKHLMNEVQILEKGEEQLKYNEYIHLMKSTLARMTQNTYTFHSNLERYTENTLEEALAYNAELERDEFLRVGADLNEDEEEIDRIMKQLKKGRWALGMTAVWKNVDDYDFRDVNEQPGDDLPENVHEGNEYEYEGYAEND